MQALSLTKENNSDLHYAIIIFIIYSTNHQFVFFFVYYSTKITRFRSYTHKIILLAGIKESNRQSIQSNVHIFIEVQIHKSNHDSESEGRRKHKKEENC